MGWKRRETSGRRRPHVAIRALTAHRLSRIWYEASRRRILSAMDNDKPSPAQKIIGDFAPKLAQLTDEVVFGDIWERPQLNKRDRSLITCAALVAMGKTEQMGFHFPRAIENGVTQEELIELITHLAFYVGWPNAMSAIVRAKELLGAP
jgi:4-carboxymuconolactone decarboxylase